MRARAIVNVICETVADRTMPDRELEPRPRGVALPFDVHRPVYILTIAHIENRSRRRSARAGGRLQCECEPRVASFFSRW